MLKSIARFLQTRLQPAGEGEEGGDEQALQVATAALLVEMSRADFTEDPAERELILDILRREFSLATAEVTSLLDEAEDEADRAVSLHEFTSLLHARLDPAQKSRVVEKLWEVALADRKIDKHEEHLVRKVANLLYLPAGELVRLKHRVLDRM